MRKGIVFIGLFIILLGGVLVIMSGLSNGKMSMSGILDRLRLSYPDRSGSEADQALNLIPPILIIIGGLIVTLGVILPQKQPEQSFLQVKSKMNTRARTILSLFF